MTKGRFINLATVGMDIIHNAITVEVNGVSVTIFFYTDEEAWEFYDQPHLPMYSVHWNELYEEWLNNCEVA